MNTQSNVDMSHARSAPKAAAAPAWKASTPATNAMMDRLETTKTGLWMSRPRSWTLS